MSFPFKTLKGRLRKVNINPYRIDWVAASASKEQMKVKQFLKPYWSKKVVCEEFMIPGTLYRIDFLNITDKIAIEHQGAQHNDPNSYLFDNPMDYLDSKRRDHLKAQWCELNGYTLVETFPEDLPVLSRKWFKEKYPEIDL